MKIPAVVLTLLILGISVTAALPTPAEFHQESRNWLLEFERFTHCKRYAEAVYIDMLMGMHMMHPEAQGKEATAVEIAKDYFIQCYPPARLEA
jgi:hypothetical protein